MATRNDSICSFGKFELDLRSRELRKSGVKLRLQDQQYQVLLRLIERKGEVVSREELRSMLWHGDTFVDFETGLNTAVKRLRDTLGDSAEKPIFIETLPRLGYRFIAPVDCPTGKDRNARKRSLIKPLGFSAAVVVLALVGVNYWRSQPNLPVVNGVVRITNDSREKNSINPPVTDGVHLYFVEGSPETTGSGIAQVAAAGGETTWIPNAQQDIWAISSVSPNRSEVLFSKGSTTGSNTVAELWVQPLPAGAPHRVGSIMALLATWTPDGTHIAYSPDEDRSSIMVANKNGSEPRQLARVPGIVYSIRYSPDGRRIRFDLASQETDSNSIWEMNADGKNVHPLLPNWKESNFQASGNWSPDGKYYYFEAGRGNDQSIWVMSDHRSIFGQRAGPSRLVSGPLHFSNPVPSGDGKRLFVLGEDPRVELVRFDPHLRRLDPYLPGLSIGPVDFSPDRKWIAYISYPDATLWRSRVDGRDKLQLTFPPVRAYEPRWSPDGSQIVFMDVPFDSPWKIRLISPSGGNPENLLPDQMEGADPTWAPDGKSIVFGDHSGHLFDENKKSEIHVLDLRTRTIATIQDSSDLFSPRLSPDGRYIAAVSLDFAKLMLFNTRTKRWSKVADGKGFGYNEWSHDSKYVYLSQSRDGAGELVRVRIKDHVVEHELNLKDVPQLDDPVAEWIGLTPKDEPLLMRNRGVQEIYALDLQFR